MNMLKELDFQAAFESFVPYDVSTCSDTPVVMRRRGARRLVLTTIITAALQAFGASVRGSVARRRQRRRARAIDNTLQRLKDHTLRDIGFGRCKISSIAAKASAEAEYTRMRTQLASHGFPK